MAQLQIDDYDNLDPRADGTPTLVVPHGLPDHLLDKAWSRSPQEIERAAELALALDQLDRDEMDLLAGYLNLIGLRAGTLANWFIGVPEGPEPRMIGYRLRGTPWWCTSENLGRTIDEVIGDLSARVGEIAYLENRPRPAASRKTRKVPRNAPCSCGSGVKFKRCHGRVC
jgi:SEC-C motif